jgi:hypothetical protein
VRAHIAPIGQGPARLGQGGAGELLGNAAELPVATTAEQDNLAFAPFLGDRTGASQSLDTAGTGEGITVVTELGQQGGGQEVASSRQGLKDEGIRVMVLHWEEGEDEPWYLATDQAATWRTIRTYKIRMWNEEMYGDMKGHGFDLEKTYMRDLDRLSLLVLGICLVYVWLIALGSWVVKNGKRHLVNRKDRRDKSHFRLGWSWLKRCLAQGQSLRLQFSPYAPK